MLQLRKRTEISPTLQATATSPCAKSSFVYQIVLLLKAMWPFFDTAAGSSIVAGHVSSSFAEALRCVAESR
jgi:hypothetical protein